MLLFRWYFRVCNRLFCRQSFKSQRTIAFDYHKKLTRNVFENSKLLKRWPFGVDNQITSKNPKNNNQILYRTNMTNTTNKIVAYHGRCFPLNKIHLNEIEAWRYLTAELCLETFEKDSWILWTLESLHEEWWFTNYISGHILLSIAKPTLNPSNNVQTYLDYLEFMPSPL